MQLPRLYELYDRNAAIEHFGRASEGRSNDVGEWVIFSHAAVCFTTVGAGPRRSHFRDGRNFVWVPEAPQAVAGSQSTQFVPLEVTRHTAGDREIHLFVQTSARDQYVYVGKLGPSWEIWGSRPDRNSGEAVFELTPALPSRLWSTLGGLRPGDLDHATLDASRDKLHLKNTTDERLNMLRHVATHWHGPIRAVASWESLSVQS